MGRALMRDERIIAEAVFRGSIPYYRVEIDPGIGLGGRAFTLPFPLPVVSPIALGYIIHGGPDAFSLGMHTSASLRATLIHELTHVWQGVHGYWATQYVHSSVWAQGWHGSHAYDYTPGLDWDAYNSEQQAKIVEDWFTGGQSEDSPLFRYIRDDIRNTRFNF